MTKQYCRSKGRRPGLAGSDGIDRTASTDNPVGTDQHRSQALELFADLLAWFVPGLDRDEAEVYVRDRIAFKVGRILEKFGLDDSERDDLSQDLLMALVRGVRLYDGKRTRWKTFLSRILDRRYRHILRKLLAPHTGVATRPVGFDDIADYYEETIVDPATTAEPFAAENLRMDVEAVISSLPDRLQIICRLLMIHPPAGAARLMGVSPATITRAVHRIRPYFERAGLAVFSNKCEKDSPLTQM